MEEKCRITLRINMSDIKIKSCLQYFVPVSGNRQLKWKIDWAELVPPHTPPETI